MPALWRFCEEMGWCREEHFSPIHKARSTKTMKMSKVFPDFNKMAGQNNRLPDHQQVIERTPACGLVPGRLLRPATRQRCAGIALRSRLARVPILWSVRLDLFPSFDDPTKFVSRDRHTTIIGFSLTCLEHRSSYHFGMLFTFPCRYSSQCRSNAGACRSMIPTGFTN